MPISVSLELTDDEKTQLASILGTTSDGLEEALAPYAQASLDEYVRMFLGQRVFTRGSDAREYRLLLLIKHAFDDRFPASAWLYRALGPMSCRCVQKSATANSPTRRTHSQRPVVAAKDRRAQGAVVANGVSGLQAGNAISGKRSRSRRGGAAGRTTSLGAALASNALPRCRASSARHLPSPAGTDPRRGDRASASYSSLYPRRRDREPHRKHESVGEPRSASWRWASACPGRGPRRLRVAGRRGHS